MNKDYDIAVVIGRYQPFHNGHLRNIKEAAKIASHVLVIVGSAEQPRTIKNPFTAQERMSMIELSVESEIPYLLETDRFHIDYVRDYLYEENKWIREVQECVDHRVNDICHFTGKEEDDVKIAILGYEKDESSYYLKSFPTWDFVDIGGYAEAGGTPIDATKIRELVLEGYTNYIQGAVPNDVFESVTDFIETDEFYTLQKEYQFIQQYKKQWADSPYPPTFFTVDAVVIQGGHVLLVRRRAAPGKGLWALPGGFIEQKETAKQSMLRELREETRLKVPEPVIKGSISAEKLFDAPGRSLRGRTITYAYLIELGSGGDSKLPKVKGGDDAAEAKWFKLNDVLNTMSDQLFEDHHSIISMMTGRAS